MNTAVTTVADVYIPELQRSEVLRGNLMQIEYGYGWSRFDEKQVDCVVTT